MASIFQEGQSTARPPLSNGSNYAYWSTRIRIFMEANSLEIWFATQNKNEAPTTEMTTWTEAQKTASFNNAKAMNVLFCSLDKNEFSRVMLCTTAYDIWRTLQVTHEGTIKVKQNKISLLRNQFSSC